MPAHIFQALDVVEGLRKGRTVAPKPIEPVEDEVVDRTLVRYDAQDLERSV